MYHIIFSSLRSFKTSLCVLTKTCFPTFSFLEYSKYYKYLLLLMLFYLYNEYLQYMRWFRVSSRVTLRYREDLYPEGKINVNPKQKVIDHFLDMQAQKAWLETAFNWMDEMKTQVNFCRLSITFQRKESEGQGHLSCEMTLPRHCHDLERLAIQVYNFPSPTKQLHGGY